MPIRRASRGPPAFPRWLLLRVGPARVLWIVAASCLVLLPLHVLLLILILALVLVLGLGLVLASV